MLMHFLCLYICIVISCPTKIYANPQLITKINAFTDSLIQLQQKIVSPPPAPTPPPAPKAHPLGYTSQQIEEKKKLMNTKTALPKSEIDKIKNKIINSSNKLLALYEERERVLDEGYTREAYGVIKEDPSIKQELNMTYGTTYGGDMLVLDYQLKYNTDKTVDLGWRTVDVFSNAAINKKSFTASSPKTESDIKNIWERFSEKYYSDLGYQVQNK